MPNFKDTYSSQDNYNTRKSINFHSNRDLNDTESIGKKHGLKNYLGTFHTIWNTLKVNGKCSIKNVIVSLKITNQSIFFENVKIERLILQ